MKKYLLVIFISFLPFSVIAESKKTEDFMVAKAVKLGRGKAYSISVGQEINTLKSGKDCHEKCKICDGTTGLCSACDNGYYLQNNICISCPANAVCEDGQEYVCKNTFYKNGDECIDICSNIKCIDGISPVVSDDRCCCTPDNCPALCQSCSDGKCVKCEAGYLLSASACTTCPANATCDGSSSYVCRTGTYRKQGRLCTYCPDNANPCDGKSSSFSCKDGYYRNDETCVQCPTQCATCSNASSCTTCKAGYYQSGSNCLKCTSSQSGGIANASELCFKTNTGTFARGYILLKCQQVGQEASILTGSAIFKSCICNTDGKTAKCTYKNENKTITVSGAY